jgi:hypothetical protein
LQFTELAADQLDGEHEGMIVLVVATFQMTAILLLPEVVAIVNVSPLEVA